MATFLSILHEPSFSWSDFCVSHIFFYPPMYALNSNYLSSSKFLPSSPSKNPTHPLQPCFRLPHAVIILEPLQLCDFFFFKYCSTCKSSSFNTCLQPGSMSCLCMVKLSPQIAYKLLSNGQLDLVFWSHVVSEDSSGGRQLILLSYALLFSFLSQIGILPCHFANYKSKTHSLLMRF